MPYRRLPNTDQARIRALKSAIQKGDIYNTRNLVVSFKILAEAKNFLVRFEAAKSYHKQCFDNQIKSSEKHQKALRNARMYISHFIQVLNLAMLRSEIKEEYKICYGLAIGSNTVPDMTNDSSVLEWGNKIIIGEKERLKNGGIPIYNPTIAKVCVHYDIFKETFEHQKELQTITSRSLKTLSDMRKDADRIILDIWNQVEKNLEYLPVEERLKKSKEYGLIYYYRTGEKSLL